MQMDDIYTSITNGYDKLSDAPKGVRCMLLGRFKTYC